jgi:hypothetical protein
MPRFCEQCGCEHATQEEIEEQARKLLEGTKVDDVPPGAEALPHERGGIIDPAILAIVGENPRETILPAHIAKGEAPEEIPEELAPKLTKKSKNGSMAFSEKV